MSRFTKTFLLSKKVPDDEGDETKRACLKKLGTNKVPSTQLAGICLVAKKPAWAKAIMAFKYDHKWMIFCKNWNPKSYSFWGNVNLVILCSNPRGQKWVVLLGKECQKWTL